MSAFTVAHVERVNHGAHLCTVTLQFGAALLHYKVLSDRNGQPWVSGLKFGEPLRSNMRQAILAAAGYATGGHL